MWQNQVKKLTVYKEFLIFCISNCLLPSIDMTTDFITFLDLCRDHPKWAFMTLTWIFSPTIIHVIQYMYRSIKTKSCIKSNAIKVLTHLPIVLPIRNLWILGIMIIDKKKYSRSFATVRSRSCFSL